MDDNLTLPICSELINSRPGSQSSPHPIARAGDVPTPRTLNMARQVIDGSFNEPSDQLPYPYCLLGPATDLTRTLARRQPTSSIRAERLMLPRGNAPLLYPGIGNPSSEHRKAAPNRQYTPRTIVRSKAKQDPSWGRLGISHLPQFKNTKSIQATDKGDIQPSKLRGSGSSLGLSSERQMPIFPMLPDGRMKIDYILNPTGEGS